MFCSNCGKQISEDTKFCNHCGAQQAVAKEVPQEVVEEPIQQPKKAPKKKANIFIVLAVVLAVFLLGKFVIAPAMVPDAGKNDDTSAQTGQSQQADKNYGGSSVNVGSSAYEAIFDDTYIVHFQTFFNMDMSSFALKQEDGTICCADYGYKDDVVRQWVETMYIPVSDYTDDQKATLENTMRTQFAAIDALNCCTVTYKMGANHFTITCTYSDVDKAENYGELYNAQILQANTFISMSGTESGLLNQGFVKK